VGEKAGDFGYGIADEITGVTIKGFFSVYNPEEFLFSRRMLSLQPLS
jgi:hypothetical protein